MIDSESHYGPSYLSHERWMSYVHQVTAIADLNPARVAEIGVGPGVVGDMVRTTYPGCDYVSVDIDPTLRPQVCASVVDLPFADASFDAYHPNNTGRKSRTGSCTWERCDDYPRWQDSVLGCP